MHAPDGFLTAGTAVATGTISLGTVSVALRQAKGQMSEKMVPLAGITAAFVFAAQMFNFPVAAGTTGDEAGYRIIRDNGIAAELPANSTSFTETILLATGESATYYIEVHDATGSVRSSPIKLTC
jgi:hypothetical protein